ncbi:MULTISPECIES: DUF6157 family protein [Bradyrhizobium]|uniref:DUF6157 family protein n=1 Tax=Bradyrhizobium TaxID=374 RepID=UPI0020A11699|nr:MULTISPECIES: DUF6157 family protein [Bradyrhizobium]
MPAIRDDREGALQAHVRRRDLRDVRAGTRARCEATKTEKRAAREAFFSRGQACMRASSLGKRFGWGVHADSEGRIAIYAIDSKRYQALVRDPKLTQVRAMRSKRA